ncbi:RibD family protein [Maricaulis salignorans]|uniref:Riboflavin-specific deaminase C-terminal domain-containing protein n=1 Tax=Maricaulis salignorans TaxID=144026 RepID=A0A1G9PAL2_9PROT|nr:RibD family protein [Maricaulis salignorans]SDL95836.1 riboflavin-specific deaminase C-terminal domain-containing protein [Maricaulis salignorans]
MSAGNPARVTLKLATSLDGRIALANGTSQWITGPESRAEVHRMRAAHAAILTGIGTILADDPRLTARPEGVARPIQPDILIMDTAGRTPATAAVHAETSRWVRLFRDRDLGAAMAGYASVMIEAGSAIAAAALQTGLVDRIEWFRAPVVLGGDGLAAIAALGLERLGAAPTFQRVSLVERGLDLHESYERIS